MMQAVRRATPAVRITSDGSGNWGCGAFSGQSWFQLKWVGQLLGHSITIKEFIPIVVAAAIWGHKWRGSTVQILCGNAAVVAILNQNSSRDREVMHLLRCLAFITAKFQFLITASHIPGIENTAAETTFSLLQGTTTTPGTSSCQTTIAVIAVVCAVSVKNKLKFLVIVFFRLLAQNVKCHAHSNPPMIVM